MVSGRLFEEFLRRADLSGDDALPYKHVKFTWYERRLLPYLCPSKTGRVWRPSEHMSHARINNYESLVAKSKRGGHVSGAFPAA